MTAKHKTSIVDISEIEDDEAPLAAAEMLHEQQDQTGSMSRHQHQAAGRSAAHLYLYHEDMHPEQRIPNLLSAIVSQAPTSQVSLTVPGGSMSAQSSPGQTMMRSAHEMSSSSPLAAIDYPKSPDWGPSQPIITPAGQSRPESRAATPGGTGTSMAPEPPAGDKANLGTLTGVYFPCVQNIFGVILFIRMVWIVGTAGVPAAFSLVFICCCVTLTTSISLSAIATNGIVPAGGSYFMISRSLGPEFGGAVGTMFWFGTTVAGAMYITGAVEIMLNYLAPSWGLFGDFQRDVSIMYNNIRVYGTLLLLLVGLMVWIGVKFVSKMAPIALFCVLFSIASIYAGIFINYNGRSDLMICVLGDRLVTLKNMPYDESTSMIGATSGSYLYEDSSAPFQRAPNASSNSKRQLSASELLAQREIRRNRALCNYEKLRYIFCPNEQNSAYRQAAGAGSNGDNQDFSEASAAQGAGQEAAPQESQEQSRIIKDLFKFEPNMSNCDPYFLSNKNKIRLEPAVPGIASGVLFQNLRPRFREKRNLVSLDDGKQASGAGSRDYNYIFVDITTSFTILISIYFPSCTGILAGSNRSGDLADAQKSIPRGTISAQLTTSFVYLSCIVLFGSTFNNLFIRDKFGESMGGQLAVTQIAWPHPYVILIGGLLSTLGASLQSLVGAPRILQGIAKDEVIPCFNRFAKLSARGEPETAIIFTLAISWLAVLIGNLDFIAPILTLSLVMCYFFINLACTLHSLLGSPAWRPRFKHYHWTISALGCVLCLFVMIVSSWVYFLIAILLAGCIYKYIYFCGVEKEWGDGKQGLALSVARFMLLRLKTSEQHTKNWRPQLLLFVKMRPKSELEPMAHRSASAGKSRPSAFAAIKPAGPDSNAAPQPNVTCLDGSEEEPLVVAHPRLLTLASQLKAGKGLSLVSSIIEGDFKQSAGLAARARQSLQTAIEKEPVKGFGDVLVAPSLMDGLSYQIQTAGLGGLKHNTVIVGWPTHWRRTVIMRPSSTSSSLAGAGSNNGTGNNAPDKQQGSFKSPSKPAVAAASAAGKQTQQGNQAAKQHPAGSKAHLFVELMRNVQASQNALLVIKGIDSWPESCDRLGGYIDIWWIVNDGGLLMLLPHLLRQHKTWKGCQLRIFTVASVGDNTGQMRNDLRKFLYHLRIEAQVDIVEVNNAEISDYAYERTLMMEQRGEIIKRLNVNRKQSVLLEQEVDGRLIKFRIRKPSTSDFEDAIPMVEMSQAGSSQAQSPVGPNGPADVASSSGAGAGQSHLSGNRPDEMNVRRMHTALTLNEAILKRSKQAKLVIINLPGAPKADSPEAENNYMEFVEIITDKLERVLLVQNGGREVITIHS